MIVLVIALPAGRVVYERARKQVLQERSQDNLRQLAQAMLRYNDEHGRLPPAVVFDKEGQPLHSWRVLILPYLGKKALYYQFRLDEPWDSAHNRRLLAAIPDVYVPPRGQATTEQHSTFYQLFDGPNGAFHSGVEQRRLRPSPEGLHVLVLPTGAAVFESDMITYLPREFPNGTANTFLVVEGKAAVPWTMPKDLWYQSAKPVPELGGLFDGDFNAALADGSVRCIRRDKVTEKTLRHAIDPFDGQSQLGWDGGCY
jgi:hypothetical protein